MHIAYDIGLIYGLYIGAVYRGYYRGAIYGLIIRGLYRGYIIGLIYKALYIGGVVYRGVYRGNKKGGWILPPFPNLYFFGSSFGLYASSPVSI